MHWGLITWTSTRGTSELHTPWECRLFIITMHISEWGIEIYNEYVSLITIDSSCLFVCRNALWESFTVPWSLVIKRIYISIGRKWAPINEMCLISNAYSEWCRRSRVTAVPATPWLGGLLANGSRLMPRRTYSPPAQTFWNGDWGELASLHTLQELPILEWWLRRACKSSHAAGTCNRNSWSCKTTLGVKGQGVLNNE